MLLEQGSMVSISSEVMGGTPVFAGTRVPVVTLLDYMKAGESINDFLEGFPTVSREQVLAFIKEKTMGLQSDEDRLIEVLRQHRDLKRWVMSQFADRGIPCQETYGNDEKGDIKLDRSADVAQVHETVLGWQCEFNPQCNAPSIVSSCQPSDPHVEIKTQYLYGQEVDGLIQQGTVVAIVSASRVSAPSQAKLQQSGIAFAENIPIAAFTP